MKIEIEYLQIIIMKSELNNSEKYITDYKIYIS